MQNLAGEDAMLRQLRSEFKAETYAASKMALGWGLLRCEICDCAPAQFRKNGRYCCGACAKSLEIDALAETVWMGKANRRHEQGQATQV